MTMQRMISATFGPDFDFGPEAHIKALGTAAPQPHRVAKCARPERISRRSWAYRLAFDFLESSPATRAEVRGR
jgi:hypothetical protein